MSRFSGKQYRGAKRVLQEIKREEAEARQKAYNKRKSFDELRKIQEQLDEPLTEVLSSEEVGAMIEKMKKTQVEIDYENNPEAQAAVERALNKNPGPALPGLAKRARKITRK